FGPSITALRLRTSFDHDNSPISVHRTYDSPILAFPRAKKVIFQELNMPDNKWNKKGLNIPLRRSFEIFVPNVNYIDMDTTGIGPHPRVSEVAMRLIKPLLIAVSVTGLSFPLISMIDRKSGAPTAYEAELSRIQKDISDLKDGASSAPSDMEKGTRYVHRIYQRALLTGSYADLNAAQATFDRAIGEIGPLADLYLFKANLDFRLHLPKKPDRDVQVLARFA